MGGGDLTTKGGEMVDEGVGVVDEGGFCEGKFWDLSLTWQTDDPDFTACFHQTVRDFCTQYMNGQKKLDDSINLVFSI